VLCDEVCCTGVEAACEETTHDKVDERPRTEISNEEIVKNELDDQVKEMPLCQALSTEDRWADGVEEDLKGAERGCISKTELTERLGENLRKHDLPEDVVQEDQLEFGWEVSIDSFLTHKFVMFNMVLLFFLKSLSNPKQALDQVWTNLKRGRIWYPNW